MNDYMTNTLEPLLSTGSDPSPGVLSILSDDEISRSLGTPAGASLPAIDQGAALLNDDDLAPPPVLISGLLHESTKGVLAGSSKVGKTWMLLDLALSVATGTPFLRWNTSPGKVLFINFEIHRAFIKNRIQLLKQRRKLANIDNLDVWTLRGTSTNFGDLTPAIVERANGTDYSLIIVDPIYKAMVGRSENSGSGVAHLCRQIERLIEVTGATLVYAHHYSKGNQSKKQAIDRLSGSGVFTRDADTIITLTEHAESGCYTVDTILRNLPAQAPFVVKWDFPVMVERPDLDPEELELTKKTRSEATQEYVLALLKDKPLTTAEWRQKASDISKPTFFRALDILERTKKVTRNLADSTWTVLRQPTSKSTDAPETIETPETRKDCSAKAQDAGNPGATIPVTNASLTQ